jgi:hypothetical protein
MKERLARHWPSLVLALVPIVPLWRCLFLGEWIGPWDQILSMAPWNRPEMPGHAWDVLSADGVLQFHVWRDYVFQSWRSLTPPFWNPHQLMGTPVLANSQSGGFYPPHILAAFTFLPTGLLIVLLTWFHFAWAGLGARRLVLNLGGGEKGAVFAGVAFSLSAFMIGWAPLSSVTSTCAWIPWCLAWTVQVFRGEAPLKAAGKLAFGVGMMFLAGHLQFSFYGVLAIVVMAVGLAIADRKVKPGLVAAIGVALGGLIAMPQLLPVLEYGRFSHRQGTATGEGYQAYLGGAIAPFELLGISSPGLMGFPGKAASVESEKPMPQYWPAYVRRGAAFAEGAVAVGPLVLVMLFLISRRHPRLRSVALVGGVGIVGALLAFGTPLNALFYFGVPGWSATGSPGRAIALLILGLAVVAGILWPRDDEEPAGGRRMALGMVGFFLGPVLLSVLLVPQLPAWRADLNVPAFSSAAIASNGLTFLLPFALFLAWALWKPAKAGHGFALAVAAQVLVSGPWTLVTSPASITRIESQPNVRHAFVEPGWGLLDRAPAIMPPNLATLYGLNDVAGYDSLLHRDTVRILHEIDGADPAPEANGNIMHIKPSADMDKLAEAGVSEVWSARPVEGFDMINRSSLDPSIEGDADKELGIYHRELAGHIVDGGTVESVSASGFTIRADGGPLLARYRNMPGWSASQNGTELPIAPGDFMMLSSVSPGPVTFKYTPPGLIPGLLLGLIGLAGMAFFLKPNKVKSDVVD